MKTFYKFISVLILIIIAFMFFQNYEKNRYAYSTITEVNQLEENLKEIKFTYKSDEISVIEDESYYLNRRDFKVDDKIVVEYNAEYDVYYITDFYRADILFIIFSLFVLTVLVVSGSHGIGALIGMLASIVVIFKLTLPWILSGMYPIYAAIYTALIIAPLTFYSSHGFKKKTHLALVGTLVTLLLAAVVAILFTDLSNLTGLASEEASFLDLETLGRINFKGLVLAGMLIGILGLLDDITISQASIVNELKESKKNISKKELFTRAMTVGTDHISSLVNTIILIYTGAALPLLLLFMDKSQSFLSIINIETLSEEIVRTLIGSIALVLAVPITTIIAVYYFDKKK